jgi:hypothetical protein
VKPGSRHEISIFTPGGSYGLPRNHLQQPPSILCPVAVTKAANSPRVTAKRATANGLAKVTATGIWSGGPMLKLPAGTTNISGQSGLSLKLSPAFRQRCSVPTNVSTQVVVGASAGFEAGKASSIAVAKLPLFLSHCLLLSSQEQLVFKSHTLRSVWDSHRNIAPMVVDCCFDGAGGMTCDFLSSSIRARANST